MDEREDRIRARAYELWEAAGRPEGRQAEHWEQAEREIDGNPAGPRKRKAGSEPANAKQTGPAGPGGTQSLVSEVPVVRRKPVSSRARKPKPE